MTIIWSEPDVDVTQCFVNLGVHNADPQEYICKYGASLIQADRLPEVAIQYGARAGEPDSSNTSPSVSVANISFRSRPSIGCHAQAASQAHLVRRCRVLEVDPAVDTRMMTSDDDNDVDDDN